MPILPIEVMHRLACECTLVPLVPLNTLPIGEEKGFDSRLRSEEECHRTRRSHLRMTLLLPQTSHPLRRTAQPRSTCARHDTMPASNFSGSYLGRRLEPYVPPEWPYPHPHFESALQLSGP